LTFIHSLKTYCRNGPSSLKAFSKIDFFTKIISSRFLARALPYAL
jgi:hypothetical protein